MWTPVVQRPTLPEQIRVATQESALLTDEDCNRSVLRSPRQSRSGPTFVYVFPCRDEDILKVGFSRDPGKRLRTLHRRFYEFFDLDRGLLIETELLREARAIERFLIEALADCRAPAPLEVRRVAAGHTEWFRGVSPLSESLAAEICQRDGWPLHQPLAPWLKWSFAESADQLYGWSSRMLELITYAHFNEASGIEEMSLSSTLRRELNTWARLGFDLRVQIPPAVFDWYESTTLSGKT